MSLVLNASVVPDSWDDETEVIPQAIITKKPVSKWVKSHPDLVKHFPLLCPKLKKLSEEDMKKYLEVNLEAVTLWKPKKADVGIREVSNKKKDDENYKILFDQWVKVIHEVGLKENSSVLERETVKSILEKYVNTKFQREKYVVDKWRNVCNIPG